jgi:hypothetical protein
MEAKPSKSAFMGDDEIHAGILAGSNEPIQSQHCRKNVIPSFGSRIMLSRTLLIGCLQKITMPPTRQIVGGMFGMRNKCGLCIPRAQAQWDLSCLRPELQQEFIVAGHHAFVEQYGVMRDPAI